VTATRSHAYGIKYVNTKLTPLTKCSNQSRPRPPPLECCEDLARESTLSVTTIRRAELAEGETSMTAANDLAVRRTLEAEGVEFIDENGDGPGVRLRKAHPHGKRK
jgi:hypothetical protein